MKVLLSGSPVDSISAYTDDEIVFIMERIDPFPLIDDLRDFFATNPDRAIKIRDILLSKGNMPCWYNLARSKMIEKKPELMGVFGLSWKEKVINTMKPGLKGSEELKMLSSFWGENTGLVDNLHNAYLVELSQGSAPIGFTSPPDEKAVGGSFNAETDILSQNISSRTGIDKVVTDAFLKSLFVLGRSGKIDLKKIDPVGYKKAKEAQKEMNTGGIVDSLRSTGSALLWVGGIAAGAYFLNSLKGFFPKT